jgi:hypothetical protein
MTNPATATGTQPKRRLRSTVAVLVGFIAVFVLSVATDEVLHLLRVYPPWNQPMYGTGLVLLALSYRLVYTVVGGYITARLAPQNPTRHALILGAVGTLVATVLAIATIPLHLGPNWYPIALVVTALPCTWLGGALYSGRHPNR